MCANSCDCDLDEQFRKFAFLKVPATVDICLSQMFVKEENDDLKLSD